MNPLEIVIPVEATGLFQYAWLMIAIPLGVAAILLLGGRATNAWGHWLGVLGVVGSFAVAAALFAQMLGADIAGLNPDLDPDGRYAARTVEVLGRALGRVRAPAGAGR